MEVRLRAHEREVHLLQTRVSRGIVRKQSSTVGSEGISGGVGAGVVGGVM